MWYTGSMSKNQTVETDSKSCVVACELWKSLFKLIWINCYQRALEGASVKGGCTQGKDRIPSFSPVF